MPTIIAMQMNSRNMLAGGLCRSKDISSITNMDSTMLHVIMSLFEVKYFLLFILCRYVIDFVFESISICSLRYILP